MAWLDHEPTAKGDGNGMLCRTGRFQEHHDPPEAGIAACSLAAGDGLRGVSLRLSIEPREEILQRVGRKTQRHLPLWRLGGQETEIDQAPKLAARGAFRQARDPIDFAALEFAAD